MHPLILSPLTKAMLRWAFSLPPEDPNAHYPQTDYEHERYGPEIRERHARYRRERVARWRQAGLCRKCGREIEATRTHLTTCEHCAEIQATGTYVQYHKRKTTPGICPQCGQEIDDPQFATCSSCRRYRRQWRYGERPAGAPARCKDCGVIFDGKRRVCARCAEARRVYKAERRRRGVRHNSA